MTAIVTYEQAVQALTSKINNPTTSADNPALAAAMAAHGIGGGTASGTTPPTSPTTGQLWYDTATSTLKVWSGTAWLVIYSQGVVQTPPQWGNQMVSNASTPITLPAFKSGSLRMFIWATGNSSGPTIPDLTQAWKYPVELIDNGAGNLVSTPTFQQPDSNGTVVTGGTLPGGFTLGTINYSAHTVTLSATSTPHTIYSWLTGSGQTGAWTTQSWYIVPLPGPYNYNYIPA